MYASAPLRPVRHAYSHARRRDWLEARTAHAHWSTTTSVIDNSTRVRLLFIFPGPCRTPFRVGFRIARVFGLEMRSVLVENTRLNPNTRRRPTDSARSEPPRAAGRGWL
ncbi:Hypothetical protein SMAX5B_003843 [Scophthalmus maximus]|uniref:Uncharacterized protein n=1 Tax=Scophthalmus maximus TaxID=52904 RepID=A0A2U9BX71_SCOMX|nr:Hypothetical protein SMAX5B_003843 [Scophthalmus maximus]